MEIITPKKITIDALVHSAYGDWNSRQELLNMSSQDAEKEALDILKKQFKSALAEVLTEDIQALMGLDIVKSASSFSVYATFDYTGKAWRIHRSSEQPGYWEYSYDYTSVICFPDSFQKQLLIEMGKVKADGLETSRNL